MIRHELRDLKEWKHSKLRKPLIIRGARQVGKTWLMKEFGRTAYNHCAYVNFESNTALKSVFEPDFDINRILLAIRIETGLSIDPENTLIIFDEIQEAPSGLTALKYFQENAPQYHLMAAGSLLGLALKTQSSFPVGKVDFLQLFPLSFVEFLEAMGESALLEPLQNRDWPTIKIFRERFIDLLKKYYFVGGMPEAVNSFAQHSDFSAVREIQKKLLIGYEHDFLKYAPHEIVPRIRMVWHSMPSQLAKENRKFIYGMLRKGARAKDYELAISLLQDSGLVNKLHDVSKPAIPLKAYEHLETFKLYMLDIGLLAAMSNVDAKILLEGNAIFTEFKGALTEQYVLQQLITQKEISLAYWSPENARSEIDFLFQHSGDIIPIEVKAEENLQARSLKVYLEKFKPKTAIRTSMSDFRKEEKFINLPLYAIGQLGGLI